MDLPRTNREPQWWLLLVGALVLGFALAGLWSRATYGARTSADEPQYLLTATSLAEDLDLDISDEISQRRYLPYHEVTLDPQTYPLDGSGRQVSPHDPLLPALLAAPHAIGGWSGSKLFLAMLSAVTAALTAWVAHARFGVRRSVAALVVCVGFAGIPLSAYGTQVYPELPAAFAAMAAIAALTSSAGAGSRPRLVASMTTVGAVVALPWLAIKYVPVAAVLAVALLVKLRSNKRDSIVVLTVLGAAAAVYLVAHQWLYGGWTVYATGDHFVDAGEFSVVGTQVDPIGRSRRIIGLLVDRQFGIAAWNPAWILLPAAIGWVLRRRGVNDLLLIGVVLAAWLNATFVALTMHGWWVPGRQLVVALPAALVLLAAWVDDRFARRGVALAALGVAGAINWVWLAFEASTGRRTLIVDFAETASLPYRAVAPLLPDGISAGSTDDLKLAAWGIILMSSLVISVCPSGRGRVCPSGRDAFHRHLGRR